MIIFDWIIIAVVSAMSLIAVIITLADKYAAKRGRWRIAESALMLVAFLFGSFAMYITMKIIRHKTRHIKFMAGIPCFMMIHIAAGIAYVVRLRSMLI